MVAVSHGCPGLRMHLNCERVFWIILFADSLCNDISRGYMLIGNCSTLIVSKGLYYFNESTFREISVSVL